MSGANENVPSEEAGGVEVGLSTPITVDSFSVGEVIGGFIPSLP
jgi:hypothetical protein